MHRSAFTVSGACSWLCLLLLCALSLCSAVVLREDQSDALERKPWMDSMERQTANDPYISELVNRLRALKEAEEIGLAQKRGLDFGMGRGFSGSLAAKHLMGLAAASYPGGPGRRRRSAHAVPSLL